MGKIFDNINSNIMEAMKAKEPARANAYRNIKAKMIEFNTAKNAKPLDDAAEITILNKMVKELYQDADTFEANGRKDLAIPAREEASYIEVFLPKAATEQDIKNCVEFWIQGQGVDNIEQKQMGIVIKFVKNELENADGKMVSDIVKKYIG